MQQGRESSATVTAPKDATTRRRLPADSTHRLTTAHTAQKGEPPPQRSGGRLQHRRIRCCGTANAKSARAPPRAAAPREQRDTDRLEGFDNSLMAAQRERAPPLTVTHIPQGVRATAAEKRRPITTPPHRMRRHGGRKERTNGAACSGAARAARRQPPRRMRQLADGHAKRARAATDGDAHRAENACRRRRGAAAERNAATSDAAARRMRGAHEWRRVQRRRESGATATVLKDAATCRRPPAESARRE